MDFEFLDKMHDVKKNVNCAKSVLMLVRNDMSNPNGSVNSKTLDNAIECAIKMLDGTLTDIENEMKIAAY